MKILFLLRTRPPASGCVECICHGEPSIARPLQVLENLTTGDRQLDLQ